jgi:hypothetical protein
MTMTSCMIGWRRRQAASGQPALTSPKKLQQARQKSLHAYVEGTPRVSRKYISRYRTGVASKACVKGAPRCAARGLSTASGCCASHSPILCPSKSPGSDELDLHIPRTTHSCMPSYTSVQTARKPSTKVEQGNSLHNRSVSDYCCFDATHLVPTGEEMTGAMPGLEDELWQPRKGRDLREPPGSCRAGWSVPGAAAR